MASGNLTESQTPDNESENKTVDGSPYTCEEVLAEIEKQQSAGRSWVKNLFILSISLFIFFRLGFLKSGLNDLLIIILVLLVHEAGHFVGMRLFGYRNVQMFFIPFFGAAVSGENQNVATYKKAIVTLLGPVPGIFLGIIFLIVYIKTITPICLQLAIMFLLINSFNLLPFFPLDGGRFLYEVLFYRNRYVELCFRVLAALALIAVGHFLGAWLLALLGVFSLISVRFPFKSARIAKDLRPFLLAAHAERTEGAAHKTADAERIPPDITKEIIAKVRKHISSQLNVKAVASYTSEVWKRMCLRPPGAFATVGLLGVYLLCFCLPFLSLIGVAVISQFENNPFVERRIVKYQKRNGETGLKHQIYSFGKLTSEIDVDPNRFVYHGKGVSYYTDGTVSKEGNWCDGKWDGEWKGYDKNGDLKLITIFDKGKFVVRKEWKDGRWVEKSWGDLPFWLRKAIIKHNESPPLGPTKRKKSAEMAGTEKTRVPQPKP